jgi:hypothetical protein
MGTDIHVYFEHKVEGKWELLWSPIPDSDYWYEQIIEKKIDIGIVLTGNAPGNAPYEFLENHFKSLSNEEIIKQYGNDPDIVWSWPLPRIQFENYCIDSRDYYWFGILSGLRGGPRLDQLAIDGLPPDMHPIIHNQWLSGKGDWHTPGYNMVSDILKRRKNILGAYAPHTGYDCNQLRWLEKFIDNPKTTRMVFWYDN